MALSDNLVAYWSLDEAFGAAIDATPNGNDVPDYYGSIASTTGKVDGCRDFNPLYPDLFRATSNSMLQIGDIDFTYTMWTFLDVNEYVTMISKGDTADEEIWIHYYYPGMRFAVRVNSGAGATGQTYLGDAVITPAISEWHFVAVRYKASTDTLSIRTDGGSWSNATHAGGQYVGTGPFYLGAHAYGLYLNGKLDEVGLWKRWLDDAEVTDLYNGGDGRDYAYIAGGAPTEYTLPAEAGAFNITGTDASLVVGRAVTAEAGSYQITGTAADLEFNHVIVAETTSYVITVSDVTLTKTGIVSLLAEIGSYQITGTDADLEFSHVVSAAAGSYQITGTAADLEVTRVVLAASTTYQVTGTAADLERSSVVTADAGAFLVTGTAANLNFGHMVSAAAGSYQITGTDATFKQTYVIPAAAGAYQITVSDVTLTKTGVTSLLAETGSYLVTGTAALFKQTYVLAAAAGSVQITGTAADLEVGRIVSADLGTYTVTGTAANFKFDHAIAAAAGSYQITGTAADLNYFVASTVIADSGSYLITGTAASLEHNRIITAETTSYLVTGTAIDFGFGKDIAAESGAYNIDGAAANFMRDYRLMMVPGVFSITGQDATLEKGTSIPEFKYLDEMTDPLEDISIALARFVNRL